ncbi:3-methyl-2-oxobutanoate hydroxymethyltransferase [Candidatus Methylospira mobilis]|uniref:3-methyl-2-oxobutanoate hydroxymethyltransferase n=1 Tax=Candidatus Methylospira mobilis TaxID=1808979 RepID=A0A5Q0BE89_9GAMM|nr:3-methyl-2-oxobutanoate hydroxymethyltransferase [Candidatus Methylospira mobilis]QFY41452.1 3-methyl-2-oxobutanoate hydroxymethyltransferase [Candidatus Methylospira mobilis]WNV05321.1 3-methyl-2-oxobutanoate hydroxymethyltransferase [Candidatus Methylospira mobilis]
MTDPVVAVTLPDLFRMKQEQRKIAALTAYDASFAGILDQAGVDVILVGDSLGMVIQGYAHTLGVTLQDIVYHTQCVARSVRRALIVADMPFMSYHSPQQAAENAARLVQQGGAHMVKLEGGRRRAEIVGFLSAQNISVCAHLGLLPQSFHQLGGFSVQARDEHAAHILLEDALILQEAGARALVLECIPAQLAAEVTARLAIPVIGIGAGADCDGQVLVTHDLLGMAQGRSPRFVKNFLAEAGSVSGAIDAYVRAVREGRFPGREHVF